MFHRFATQIDYEKYLGKVDGKVRLTQRALHDAEGQGKACVGVHAFLNDNRAHLHILLQHAGFWWGGGGRSRDSRRETWPQARALVRLRSAGTRPCSE